MILQKRQIKNASPENAVMQKRQLKSVVLNTHSLHRFHTMKVDSNRSIKLAMTIKYSEQSRLCKASDPDTKDKGGCDVKNHIPVHQEHSE